MASIVALGTALPTNCLPTDDFIAHAKQFACSNAKQERILEELYRRTAIQQRASVLAGNGYGQSGEAVFAPGGGSADLGPTTGKRMQYYEAEIGELAHAACEAAFADSPVQKQSITHIVTVSCTGFNAPGFDIELIHSLPLARSTMRTHVGFMGCHGGMNGLRVANAYVTADPSARVLLCTSEACSLHFQYGWSTDKLVANSLFSDGAAAMIIAGDTTLDSSASADSTASVNSNGPRWKIIDSASFIVPDTTEAMAWRIGDHGFEMHLSTAVPDMIEQWLPEFLNGFLAKHNLSRADIASWAIHPGGPKILDAVQLSLQLGEHHMQPSRDILATCGNMSSPTVFFILDKLRKARQTGPCVILGFGPGLTVEAALVELA
jgi:predicted naringenin-chalcone synthase